MNFLKNLFILFFTFLLTTFVVALSPTFIVYHEPLRLSSITVNKKSHLLKWLILEIFYDLVSAIPTKTPSIKSTIHILISTLNGGFYFPPNRPAQQIIVQSGRKIGNTFQYYPLERTLCGLLSKGRIRQIG